MVVGCKDPNALNYNPNADVDDRTLCVYPVVEDKTRASDSNKTKTETKTKAETNTDYKTKSRLIDQNQFQLDHRHQVRMLHQKNLVICQINQFLMDKRQSIRLIKVGFHNQ